MGYGNVGFYTVEKATECGYPIVGISDVRGGVYNANGLDIAELNKHVLQSKTVVGFKGGDAISNDELLELQDIDVLIPAALEHVITVANASKISAKVIIEGANSPTTPEADKILESRGIIVIPDVCANAKGVTVSYFEWARNVNYRDERVPSGDKAHVLLAAKDIILRAADEMYENALKYNTSLRNAAFVTAIDHVTPLFMAKHIA